METKNSDSKITSLMGSTTVHVIGEVVALGGVLYYVNSQTSQLNAKITSLEQKVANLTDILRNIVPGAFSQKGQRLINGNNQPP
jgi:Tfp pilus assembly protein PilN